MFVLFKKSIFGENELLKVSIIVPVFNMLGIMEDGIESLLNQTYNNLEIILVDDGSNDGSTDYLREIANKNDRVKLFVKENGGLADARNFGVLKSTGKYIMFFDPDDLLEMETVDVLVKATLERTNIIDVVVFNSVDIDAESGKLIKYVNHGIMPGNAGSVAWNKFIRREYWVNNFSFPTDVRFEDTSIIPLVVATTSNVILVEKYLYFYRKNRQGSLLTSSIGNSFEDDIEAIRHLVSESNCKTISSTRDFYFEIFVLKRMANSCLKYGSRINVNSLAEVAELYTQCYLKMYNSDHYVKGCTNSLKLYLMIVKVLLNLKSGIGLDVLFKLKKYT